MKLPLSGNDFSKEHPLKILEKYLTFNKFHFDISGNNFNEEQ